MTAPTYPDIAAFVVANLDRLEAELRAAICPCGGPVCNVEQGWFKEHELLYRFDVVELKDETEEDYTAALTVARCDPYSAIHSVDFILEHTPKKVLADIAAKRAIVAEYRARCLLVERDGWVYDTGMRDVLRRVIQLLAAPFADQPGWQQEWAVG